MNLLGALRWQGVFFATLRIDPPSKTSSFNFGKLSLGFLKRRIKHGILDLTDLAGKFNRYSKIKLTLGDEEFTPSHFITIKDVQESEKWQQEFGRIGTILDEIEKMRGFFGELVSSPNAKAVDIVEALDQYKERLGFWNVVLTYPNRDRSGRWIRSSSSARPGLEHSGYDPITGGKKPTDTMESVINAPGNQIIFVTDIAKGKEYTFADQGLKRSPTADLDLELYKGDTERVFVRLMTNSGKVLAVADFHNRVPRSSEIPEEDIPHVLPGDQPLRKRMLTALESYFRSAIRNIEILLRREDDSNVIPMNFQLESSRKAKGLNTSDDIAYAQNHRYNRRFHPSSIILDKGVFVIEQIKGPAKIFRDPDVRKIIIDEANKIIASHSGENLPDDTVAEKVIYSDEVLFCRDKITGECFAFAAREDHRDHVDLTGRQRTLVYYSGIIANPSRRGGLIAILTDLLLTSSYKQGRAEGEAPVPFVARLQDDRMAGISVRYMSARGVRNRELSPEHMNRVQFLADKKNWPLSSGPNGFNIQRGAYEKDIIDDQKFLLPELRSGDAVVISGEVGRLRNRFFLKWDNWLKYPLKRWKKQSRMFQPISKIMVASRKFWKAYFWIYDRLCNIRPYQDMIDRGIEELGIQQMEAVLDIGCGTGNSTLPLAAKKGMVTAFDFSLAAIEIASAKVRDESVAFDQADINERLPYKEDSFHKAFSSNVLYLAKDPQKTLREIFRVLKPGGKLVMLNPRENPSPKAVLEEHFRIRKQELRENHNSVMVFLLTLFDKIKRYLDFLMFIPFVLFLKSGSPSMKGREYWENAAKEAGFEIESVEPAYAGQNYIYSLIKPSSK